MRFQDKCSCNNCGDCKIQALEAKYAFQAEMLERANTVCIGVRRLTEVYGRQTKFPSNKERRETMAPRGQRHKVWDALDENAASLLSDLESGPP